MKAKDTLEKAQKLFFDKGYSPLFSEYKSSADKLDAICPVHGKFQISLGSIKAGRGCRQCGYDKLSRTFKVTLEDARQAFLDKGYTPLFTEYKNSTGSLLASCPTHGEFYSTYSAIQSRGCPQCGRSEGAKKIRTPFEEIKKLVSDAGFELLNETYDSHDTLLEVKCSKHGVAKKTLKALNKNGFCTRCSHIRRAALQRRTLDEVKQEFTARGYEPLFEEFKGTKELLRARCPIHGEFKIRFEHLNEGHGCKKCGYVILGNKTRTSIETIRGVCEKLGFELISTSYSSFDDELELNCKKHGVFNKTLEGLRLGQGCQSCSAVGSKGQTEIANLISSHFKIVHDARKIIGQTQLDVYVPEKNFAIEYCGLYWHSEKFKDSNFHKMKLDLCRDKGISLITIFEDEWLNKSVIVEAMLKAKLGLLPKIGARQTSIVIGDTVEAKKFLASRHLQGAGKIEYSVLLKHAGKTVAVLTVSKHHRDANKYVINRVCFGNIQIVGGFTKMLKAITPILLGQNVSELVTWSDNRWSNGEMYKAAGFELLRELPPDYSYFKGQTRFSKQSCSKAKLALKGAVGPTELEMAKSLNLARIWDCGKMAWSIKLRP